MFVNAKYSSSGRCDKSIVDIGDARRNCHEAYVVSAELTGVSQLVALLCAPAFGFWSERSPQSNIPLIFAALTGVAGNLGFAFLQNPEFAGINGFLVFVVVALLGISQIGAIVCSLGLLGGSIAFPDSQQPPSVQAQSAEAGPSRDTRDSSFDRTDLPGESTMLLPQPPPAQNLVDLKGSIAGVYSLAGGIGILLLTKLGGLLFDKISMIAPFVILAVFNLLLLVIGILLALFHRR